VIKHAPQTKLDPDGTLKINCGSCSQCPSFLVSSITTTTPPSPSNRETASFYASEVVRDASIARRGVLIIELSDSPLQAGRAYDVKPRLTDEQHVVLEQYF
jgi:hypothetical protein